MLSGARAALDEAVAKVTRERYDQLKDVLDGGDVRACVERARESLDLLLEPEGDIPDYDDEWVALLYIIRYQPRQVNLVHSVLLESAPKIHAPVHVVDVGSGIWASMIALAIFLATRKPTDRKADFTIHGIEPSKPMRRLGEELWLEFGCAVERRELAPIVETWCAMTDTITTSSSLDACSSSTRESWLLAVHVVYKESKDAIRGFLDDYRVRNRGHLRYEMITSDDKKKWMVRNLIVPGSGQWLGPRPQDWHMDPEYTSLRIWKGVLPETTTVRHDILGNSKVRWDSHNDVRDDAIWVRRAP